MTPKKIRKAPLNLKTVSAFKDIYLFDALESSLKIY